MADTPVDQEKQEQLYRELIGEVKVRCELILFALNSNLRIPTPFVREFCYLQLRMLCELIAIACLVAHGEITFFQSKDLTRNYSADDIIKRLTQLRSHFFPLAVTQKATPLPSGNNKFEISWVNPPPLPKEDLIKLYGLTHQHVHRGSLNKLLSSKEPIEPTINAPEIFNWADKIRAQLWIHTIFFDKDRGFICYMEAGNGQIVLARFSSTPPKPT